MGGRRRRGEKNWAPVLPPRAILDSPGRPGACLRAPSPVALGLGQVPRTGGSPGPQGRPHAPEAERNGRMWNKGKEKLGKKGGMGEKGGVEEM